MTHIYLTLMICQLQIFSLVKRLFPLIWGILYLWTCIVELAPKEALCHHLQLLFILEETVSDVGRALTWIDVKVALLQPLKIFLINFFYLPDLPPNSKVHGVRCLLAAALCNHHIFMGWELGRMGCFGV